MEINTPIAEDMRIAGDKARLDASCKRLLSEKSILAWIMKSCWKNTVTAMYKTSRESISRDNLK